MNLYFDLFVLLSCSIRTFGIVFWFYADSRSIIGTMHPPKDFAAYQQRMIQNLKKSISSNSFHPQLHTVRNA